MSTGTAVGTVTVPVFAATVQTVCREPRTLLTTSCAEARPRRLAPTPAEPMTGRVIPPTGSAMCRSSAGAYVLVPQTEVKGTGPPAVLCTRARQTVPLVFPATVTLT